MMETKLYVSGHPVCQLACLTNYALRVFVGLKDPHTTNRRTYEQWWVPICRRSALRFKAVPFIINEETTSHNRFHPSCKSLRHK